MVPFYDSEQMTKAVWAVDAHAKDGGDSAGFVDLSSVWESIPQNPVNGQCVLVTHLTVHFSSIFMIYLMFNYPLLFPPGSFCFYLEGKESGKQPSGCLSCISLLPIHLPLPRLGQSETKSLELRLGLLFGWEGPTYLG